MMARAISGKALGLVLALTILISVLIVWPDQVHAALNNNNILDTINDKYHDVATSWIGTMVGYARVLFLSLALISLAWLGAQLALGNLDMSQFITEFIKWVMFIGFGLALLAHATTWLPDIVNSFRQAAASAASVPNQIKPSDVFDLGVDISTGLGDQLSWTAPIQSIIVAISAFIILICFAIISAWLLISLIEMYIVLNAGVLLLGFGGSYWTKEISFKYLLYTISIGAKLMTIIVLIGLGQSLVNDWQANFSGGYQETFVLAGASIVLLAVIKEIPSYVQALVSGASLSSAGSVLSSGASVGKGTIGSAVAGTALAAGGAAAIKEATKMAGEEGKVGAARVLSGLATGGMALAKSTGASMIQPWGNLFTRAASVGPRAHAMVKEQREAAAAARGSNSTSSKSGGSISAGKDSSASDGGSPARDAAGLTGQGGIGGRSRKDHGKPDNNSIT